MKVDYKPRRCYVDDQGNTIDPRTSWDHLLKHYRKYRKLLGVGEYSECSTSNTPLQALKLIIAERIHQENKRKASELESKGLEEKENKENTRAPKGGGSSCGLFR